MMLASRPNSDRTGPPQLLERASSDILMNPFDSLNGRRGGGDVPGLISSETSLFTGVAVIARCLGAVFGLLLLLDLNIEALALGARGRRFDFGVNGVV